MFCYSGRYITGPCVLRWGYFKVFLCVLRLRLFFGGNCACGFYFGVSGFSFKGVKGCGIGGAHCSQITGPSPPPLSCRRQKDPSSRLIHFLFALSVLRLWEFL